MARPRKPTALKVLTGTDQPCRTNKNEPKLSPTSPPVPRHLTGKVRWAWHRLVKIIGPMRVLTKADAVALELAAEAYAEMVEASEVVEKEGFTFVTVTESGAESVKIRPEVMIRSDAWRRLEKMISHFGLSPSTRSKVSVVAKLKEGNPFDQFKK
jgi:P27 family predicted phage terminase small subunit